MAVGKQVVVGGLAPGANFYLHITQANTTPVQYWNEDGTAPALENYDITHWTSYDIAGVEGAPGVYYFTIPDALATGVYNLFIYQRLGGATASTDPFQMALLDYVWNTSANIQVTLADITSTLSTMITNQENISDDISATEVLAGSIYTYLVNNMGVNGAQLTGILQLATIVTNLATLATYVDTEVAAIKAKTDNLPSDPADASDIAASFASIAAILTAIGNYIDTEVAAIKAKTDNLPSDPADASDVATATNAIAALLASVDGHSVRDHLAYQSAILLGLVSGVDDTGPNTEVFKGLSGTNRVSVTIDAVGNRTTVVLDP